MTDPDETTPRARRAGLRAAMVVVATALVAVACGNSGPADTAPTDPGTPGAVVSLSPTATEILFAIGAGDQVVAVDDMSDYPADAPRTDLSGYTPNVEAILGFAPDLVVASADTNGLVAGLDRVGVRTVVQPAAESLDDTYAQIRELGDITGHRDRADELVERMRSDIDEIVASVPDRATPLRYYHELDDTYYSITDAAFAGRLYSMLGLTSVATGGDPYPQLTSEFIVDADPDLVFLADAQCCGVTPEAVAGRAGWGEIAAVRDDRVFAVDEDTSSRWGPRVVDFLREVAGLVASVPDAAPAR